MGYRTWLPAACALVVALCGCGEDRTRRADGIAALQPDAVDFGKVGLGTTASKTVVLRNHGRAPLGVAGWKIEGLGEDFAISLEGRRAVFEGETAVLHLRFTPKVEERMQRILVVETDDPERTTIEVPVTGLAVTPHVVADPESLDFGRVELGVLQTLPLTLKNEFDIAVDVRIGIRGDAQFSSAPPDLARVPPLGEAVVQVGFEPSRLGTVVGELVLVSCPSCAEIIVPLKGVGIDQALVIVPPEVDFRFIPVERSGERSFTVTNVSSRPVEILSMTLVGPSLNFSITPVLGVLEPGTAVQVVVGFSPTLVDPEEQRVEIASTSARAPVVEVLLKGAGGGPQIQVSPEALSFGAVPVGSRRQIDLLITNAGTTPGAPPLEILDIRVENPTVGPFGPDRDLAANPVILDAGEQDRVAIGYEPPRATADGAFDTAELVVISNDANQPEIRIPMQGTGFLVPPCTELELAPSVLDFGQLDLTKGAVLTFKIFNPSSEMCIMRNLRIAPGSDPAFRTREVLSFLIPPAQWFGWMVEFDPAAVGAGEGNYQGEVELFAVNATLQQRYSIPLLGRSDDGCLVPDPNFLDFGSERTGCGLKEASVRFTNACPLPLGIGPITLGEQPSPGEFEIIGAPTPPFAIGAGAAFDVHIRWNTLVRGISSAPLYVMEDTRLRPLMVPLLGEVVQDGRTVDRFIQQKDDTADILFVIDNSSSMVEEQPRIMQASHVLIDEAERRGVDFHIGVTSMGLTPGASQPPCPGGAGGGEAGRLFPVDASRERIVTPTTPNSRGVFAGNTQVGFCHELEQGMEAMRLSLSSSLAGGENAGFLRDTSKLSVVFVSDEDDHSGFPASDYAEFLLSLKGEGGALVHAIVDTGEGCPEGAGRGNRFIDLATSTGGVIESLCQADWSGAMQRIADRSFANRTAFSLSSTPDGDGIKVFVNGTEATPSTYRYEPTSNSVTFAPGSVPAPGAVIEIRYMGTCG